MKVKQKPLLVAIALATLLGAGSARPTGYSEFSLDEFFDIKRAVSNLKVKQAAQGLVRARSEAKKLQQVPLQKLVFHGQDHYQQHFDEAGKESWFHVGRPDELVFNMFFKYPVLYNGTFVEVGAADGTRSSNTLFFEETLGWKGLLVEGCTDNFLALYANGRRKNSVKVYSAVCSEKGVAKYIGDGLAAGAIEHLTLHHIESWAKHFKSLRIYEVPCDRMSSLVERGRLPRVIDLMSVDVEGGEYVALETFDWSAHDVRVLIIEPGVSCFRRGNNVCAELLKQQGFCLVARRAVNEFWVSDPLFRQTYCL